MGRIFEFVLSFLFLVLFMPGLSFVMRLVFYFSPINDSVASRPFSINRELYIIKTRSKMNKEM